MSAQTLQASPQMVSTPAKTAKGMNPPHGQPGHRCDISVGAPLNSKPNKTAAPTANTTTSYTVNPTSTTGGAPALLTPPPAAANPAAAVETAPGTNPPHGQPGHVCGTPVGAPLNGDKKEEKKD